MISTDCSDGSTETSNKTNKRKNAHFRKHNIESKFKTNNQKSKKEATFSSNLSERAAREGSGDVGMWRNQCGDGGTVKGRSLNSHGCSFQQEHQLNKRRKKKNTTSMCSVTYVSILSYEIFLLFFGKRVPLVGVKYLV